MTSGKFSENGLKTAERRYAALKLRQQGFDFYQVAQEMQARFPDLGPGYNHLAAWSDINQMLANIREEMTESVPDVIMIESQRLDEMTRSLWPKAMAGRERAIELILRIQERRAKMLGIDAATQVDWKLEIASMYEAGALSLNEIREQLGEELFAAFTSYVESRKLSERKSPDPLVGLKKSSSTSGDDSISLFLGEKRPDFADAIESIEPVKPIFQGSL